MVKRQLVMLSLVVWWFTVFPEAVSKAKVTRYDCVSGHPPGTAGDAGGVGSLNLPFRGCAPFQPPGNVMAQRG